MESDRFDALTARLAGPLSRRRSVGLFAALGIASTRLADQAEAKKRKKPKKCTSCTECQACRKGKCKPKPEGSACTGGLCTGGSCTCANGFKSCQGRCILNEQCCTAADCGQGSSCQNGTCVCLDGFKRCGTRCIPVAQCCSNSDCTGGRKCVSGTCAFASCNAVECPINCSCWGFLPNDENVCVTSGTFSCANAVCTGNGGCGPGQACMFSTCGSDNVAGRCVSVC